MNRTWPTSERRGTHFAKTVAKRVLFLCLIAAVMGHFMAPPAPGGGWPGGAGTMVAVYHGVVGVAILGSGDEVRVPAGQMISVHNGTIEAPRPIPQQSRAAGESPLTRQARHEVGLDMTRNEVIAAAAMEQ